MTGYVDPPITFTENVKSGVSVITCDVCGQIITAELKHIEEFHS